ncbi:MAG TPA: ABC transporter ATP-binding protein [Candidatus Woesearchaeota archaeon]|nr:ABC transporter ATP-binding protein [Candidatus Woesearchaeota archaeon]
MKNNSKNPEKEKKPIDFRYNFARYWEIARNYKGLIIAVLILILFFQASYSAESFIFKFLTDSATLFISGEQDRQAFTSFLILLAAAFLTLKGIQAIFRWVWMSCINKLETSMMFDLKRKLFNHLINLDHEFHTSNKTGSIISRLLRGANAIERLTDVFVFNFIPLLFQTAVVAGTIMIFDFSSSITVLVTISAFIAFSFYINKKQQAYNIAANDAEDYEKGAVSDFFTNIDSIKYFGKEERTKASYKRISNNTRGAFLRHWNFFRWLSSGHNLILGIGLFFIICFPVLRLLEGEITFGSIVFIYTSFGSMIGHLYGFDHGLRGFYRSMADFESLFRYHRVKKTIIDRPGAKKLRIKKGRISFEKVYFKYKNRYVLRNFTLDIPPEKKIAFVGPSGSGKSTLIKLLYRLYDVNSGSIRIDGGNIREFQQESLRSELSIVPQEPVLFDDTIYNNILFSNPKAKRKDIFKAMRFAQLDRVVAGFPDKEKTIVGERGMKLSGGEKQRVSIARAILADKKVLVLDEATSSLDSETESEIQRDLEKLMKGRTSIVIAHRLSTIMKADLIVVMNNGRIEQAGTHKELIKQEGLYKKLWNLQKGGYI